MISEILVSAWKACQDCDLLIEAPNTMAGQHIAEALRIPIFRAFTMPWTKTRAYPHAFFVPEKKYGGTYNYMSHVMFQASYWSGVAGLVNAWRGTKLGLPPTSPALMQQERIPFLYNFSPSVVSTPLDWDSWIKITGYWFLDEGGSTYTAPQPLVDFIKKAKDDNKKIVYIGFGSIVIEDASAFTRKIVEAVVDADVRCILSKGWSNRLETNSPVSEAPLPNSIFSIDKAPHDWLFSQMDAAMHHGGAGTTGASIRAGLPVIIKPFFGDQWFFAQRVEDLGIGIRLPQIEVDTLAAALKEVTSSPRVIARAKELGEKVRSVSNRFPTIPTFILT
jgi:sterol 3beta-glucosyltransferase